jgi:REP element-mobilizing transposase RayT
MDYNSQKGKVKHFHNRRSIRLKGYDYSQDGLYFITICCENKVHRFGKIKNDEMVLNENGTIANNEWFKLLNRYPNFELDVFQIMPNHMHGIISLKNVGATISVAPNTENQNTENQNTENQNTENQNTENQNTENPMENIQSQIWAGASPAPTISDIVGAYKSLVANGCLKLYKSENKIMGKFWQRNYYEHIIRNENSYHTISNYIINNPAKWNDDKFNGI